jgi:hypothetical protein
MRHVAESVALFIAVVSFAQDSQRVETKEEPGNAILMQDEFEYRLIDYGIGKVQLRPQGSTGRQFSNEVFWMELRLTNKSEHQIRTPRHFTSSPLQVEDNWNNHYGGRNFEFAGDVGGSWFGVTLPAAKYASSSYKPGEASNVFRIIPLKDFVQDLTELRVYVAKNLTLPPKYLPESHYFRVRDPFQRKRDLLYSQDEPTPAIPQISTVAEFEQQKKH